MSSRRKITKKKPPAVKKNLDRDAFIAECVRVNRFLKVENERLEELCRSLTTENRFLKEQYTHDESRVRKFYALVQEFVRKLDATMRDDDDIFSDEETDFQSDSDSDSSGYF